MFTPSDFKLIQRICPTDLLQLLNLLGIDNQKMNFAGDNEFEKYEDLDAAIEEKICAKLQSKSVLEGYAKLLDSGRVAYSSSETRIELLKKILANREKIQAPNSYGKVQSDFKVTFSTVEERSILNFNDSAEVLTSIKENWKDIPKQLTLTARKKELSVSKATESKIKKILKEELDSSGLDIEEIAVSIICKSNTDTPKTVAPLPNKKYDDIFKTLEQVGKIFDKI